MIGNAAIGSSQQAHQDHARRVQTDAERHERAQREISRYGDHRSHARNPSSTPPPREKLPLGRDMRAAATRSAMPMPIWIPLGPPGNDARAKPCAQHRGRDHRNSVAILHFDKRRIDQCLRDRRDRMPTLSVPGISRRPPCRNSRNSDVVVAKDPMPSVSKKFVKKPTPSDGPKADLPQIPCERTPMTARKHQGRYAGPGEAS